jgi:hypothetical protein
MSADLLARLADLGVSVERQGGQLILDGPEAVLSDALVTEVAAAKPALLAVLDPRASGAEAARGGAPPPSDQVQPAPWRCRACGSGERRRRAEWGDWVCAFCRVIVAGPDKTEQPWCMARRYGPFPGTGQPSVSWGRERGYLAVRDPHSGDWHEIPYREAPPVWQAAVRAGRQRDGAPPRRPQGSAPDR